LPVPIAHPFMMTATVREESCGCRPSEFGPMYKDQRKFIDPIDRLGAQRRSDDADPRFAISGTTEVVAGLPDWPALLFDGIKVTRVVFAFFHQPHNESATGRAGTRSRPEAAAARRTQCLDGETPDVAAGCAGNGRPGRVSGKQPHRFRGRYRAYSGADLAPWGTAFVVWHAATQRRSPN
jgi:hypothetical protein